MIRSLGVMRLSHSAIRPVIFALGGATLLLAACGGGSDLQPYFEAITASEETRQTETFGAVQGGDVLGNIGYFEVLIPVLEAEERRLSEIEPPEDVVALHADYLASRTEILRIATAVLSRLNEIQDGPSGERQQAFEKLASDPDIGIANFGNYVQSAKSSCQRLSDLAVSNNLEQLRCDEQGEVDDAPLVTVTSASCDDRPTRGANLSQQTRTQLINETTFVLRIFPDFSSTVFVEELQPGEAVIRASRIGTLFRAESENGECVGIYKTAFPSQRAQFTGD